MVLTMTGRARFWLVLVLVGMASERADGFCVLSASRAIIEIPPLDLNDHARDMEEIRRIRTLKPQDNARAVADYATPPPKALWERGMVIVDWMMASYVGYQFFNATAENPYAGITSIFVATLTYYLVDATVQIIHKSLDSFLSEKNYFFGPAVRDFRKHHEYPNNLNPVGYFGQVSPFAVLFAPLFAGATVANASLNIPPEVNAGILVFLISAIYANETHRQAHLKDPAAWARVLQKINVIVRREDHRLHHLPPFNGNYSGLSGWAEPMARRLDLWRRMDLAFWRFFERMPHNWAQDPKSIPDEVVQQLRADLQKIPQELWQTAATYPARVPGELKEPIKAAKLRWQKDFIATRRQIFQEQAEINREAAETAWFLEQQEYPWIYGGQQWELFEP